MENLDTSTPKEMSNTGTPKRLNRKQRRDIKFRRGIWKQKNRRLKGWKKK